MAPPSPRSGRIFASPQDSNLSQFPHGGGWTHGAVSAGHDDFGQFQLIVFFGYAKKIDKHGRKCLTSTGVENFNPKTTSRVECSAVPFGAVPNPGELLDFHG